MELQPPQLAVFAQHALHIRGLRELVQRVCLSLLRRLRRLLSATRREVRLQSCTHHAEEPTASKVNTLGLLVCDRLDWQHNIPLKDLADRHACVACHGCVDRVVRQDGAIHAVICVWSHRANHVGRVDILDCKRQLHLLEPIQDLVSQPRADICELHITACIDFAGAAKHRVPAALGDDDHAVALCLHQADAVLEDLVGRDIHLRQEADVHIPGRQACIHGDKAAMPPHELHQANAISIASRLGVSGLHSLQCLGTRRVEAEGPIQDVEVVLHGLRDRDDRALVATIEQELLDVDAPAVRAVSADDEELADAPGLQGCGHLLGGWVAAVVHEHAAALHVDVLHDLGRQIDPGLWFHATVVAALDTIDGLNAVGPQHVAEFADHIVQTRTKPTARHDGGRHAWLSRVEVQQLPWRRPAQLQVGSSLRLRSVVAGERLRVPRVALEEDVASDSKDSALQRIPAFLGGEGAAQVSALHALDHRPLPQDVFRLQRRRQVAQRIGAAPCGARVGETIWLEAGLPCCEEHPREPSAVQAHAAPRNLREHLQGHIDVALVYLRDAHTGKPGHRAVHGMLRKHSAIVAIERVRLLGPNCVGGVDVLNGQRLLLLLEACEDLVLQPRPDVQLVCGSLEVLEESVPATIRDRHDTIALLRHDGLAMVQDLVQGDLHLRKQADVHVTGRQSGLERKEAAVQASQLDHADAICVACRLDVCRGQGVPGHRACGVKAERAVQERDVVIDRRGDRQASAGVVDAGQGGGHLQGAAHCAIASEHEELPDAVLLEHLCSLGVARVPTTGLQDAAALLVDVLHELVGHVGPFRPLQNTLEAIHDPIDPLDAIAAQGQDDFADRIVLSGGDAAGCEHRSASRRILRIEVQGLPRAGAEQLVVNALVG
mmetsp:Transcript_105212/g.304335  ORF Transcript_105212/g.304335 Transcript_105212/m.304335 type:complete len:889 (-) Transcript_105212:6713-9379(-)